MKPAPAGTAQAPGNGAVRPRKRARAGRRLDLAHWVQEHRTLSAVLLQVLGALLLVALIVLAMGVAQQAWHRVLKALLGATIGGVFLLRPGLSLFVLPFVFPYLEWLPKSPIPAFNAMNLIVISLAGGWLFRVVTTRSVLFEPSPWNLPMGLFLGWFFFTWMRPIIYEGGGWLLILKSMQIYWGAVAGLFLFFLVYSNVRTWKQIKQLTLLICVGSGLGLWGILKTAGGFGWERRVGGALGQINVAGAYYATTTLFCFGALMAGYRGMKTRLVLLACLAASSLGLIIPGSRGAFVGFAAGLLPLARRTGPALIVGVAVFAAVFYLAAPDYVMERLEETSSALSADNRYEALNRDGGGRLDFWKATLMAIQDDFHWVYGVGFGRVARALRPYLGEARPSHNVYLETAAEMGIPGLLLLLWLFGSVLRWSWWLMRWPGFPRGLGVAVAAGTVALMVSNIFGGRLYAFNMAGLLSLMAALTFRARDLLMSGIGPDDEEGSAAPVPDGAGS